MSAFQAGAAWPMSHYCPTRTSRSPFTGPKTAVKKWTQPYGGPLVVAADGTIFATDPLGGKLAALSTAGTVLWSLTLPSSCSAEELGCPMDLAIAADGRVIVGYGALYAVTPTSPPTLTTLAAAGTPDLVGPLLLPSGDVLYETGTTLVTVGLDGTMKSKLNVGITVGNAGSSLAPASLDLSGDLLVPGFSAPSANGPAAVGVHAGAVAWATPLDSGFVNSLGPLVVAPDGSAVFHDNLQLFGVLGAAGAVTWSQPAEDVAVPGLPSSAIGADGTIYGSALYDATDTSVLSALDATGKVKWKATTSTGCALVVDAQGTVFCGAAAFDPATGAALWTVPNVVAQRAMALTADGMLLMSDDEQTLTAIGP